MADISVFVKKLLFSCMIAVVDKYEICSSSTYKGRLLSNQLFKLESYSFGIL